MTSDTKNESKENGRRSRRRSSSSSSRSRSRDRRSRTRSRSRSRDRRRRRRSHSSRSTFSRSESPAERRLHIANLDDSVRRRDVEDAFAKFGRLADLWVASYPPFYAFVVYERGDDAREAMKAMRNGYIRNCPIRTTIALPRNSGRRMPPPRRYYDESDRDRDRSHRRTRSRSRSRSRGRKRSRSRTPPKKSRRSRSRS